MADNLDSNDWILVDRRDADGVGKQSAIPAVNVFDGIGVGYGSGSAVTQITSRTTAVEINAYAGAITMFAAAGSATAASFTVTNNKVAAGDVVVASVQSATNLYDILVTAVAAGSFQITFRTTGGTTSDSPVINFAVIKAVAA